ncbi:hypothetical protein LJC59_04290 [Desulfovibrio sp. OttesenSCG-928-A18]|nr:hypothetical protein [Desulfovibrio sp. OttesenSCG-928-A18]
MVSKERVDLLAAVLYGDESELTKELREALKLVRIWLAQSEVLQRTPAHKMRIYFAWRSAWDKLHPFKNSKVQDLHFTARMAAKWDRAPALKGKSPEQVHEELELMRQWRKSGDLSWIAPSSLANCLEWVESWNKSLGNGKKGSAGLNWARELYEEWQKNRLLKAFTPRQIAQALEFVAVWRKKTANGKKTAEGAKALAAWKKKSGSKGDDETALKNALAVESAWLGTRYLRKELPEVLNSIAVLFLPQGSSLPVIFGLSKLSRKMALKAVEAWERSSEFKKRGLQAYVDAEKTQEHWNRHFSAWPQGEVLATVTLYRAWKRHHLLKTASATELARAFLTCSLWDKDTILAQLTPEELEQAIVQVKTRSEQVWEMVEKLDEIKKTLPRQWKLGGPKQKKLLSSDMLNLMNMIPLSSSPDPLTLFFAERTLALCLADIGFCAAGGLSKFLAKIFGYKLTEKQKKALENPIDDISETLMQ